MAELIQHTEQQRLYDLKKLEEEERLKTRNTVNRVNFLEELNTRGMNLTPAQRVTLYEAGRELKESSELGDDLRKIEISLMQFDAISKAPGFEELSHQFESRLAKLREAHPLFYAQNFKGLSHFESDRDQTPDSIHKEGSGTSPNQDSMKGQVADFKAHVYFTANSLYAAEDALRAYEMLKQGRLPDLLIDVLNDIRKSISDLHRADSILQLIENREGIAIDPRAA